MKKYIFILPFAASVFLSGCSQHYQPEMTGVDELGFVVNSIEVDATRGTVEIPILSNSKGEAVVSEDCASWFAIADRNFDGDKTLYAEYLANTGFPRKATVLIKSDTRRDTLFVYQRGLEEKFDFKQNAVVVYNGRGRTAVEAELNMKLREVDISVNYLEGDAGWIKQYGLSANKLWLETEDNKDEDAIRRAEMILKWKDGWDVLNTKKLTITQANARNMLGIPITFEQLREMATVEGSEITDDVILTCYVGGVPQNNQAGECGVIEASSATSDFDSNDLTSYIQNEDGSLGMRVMAFSKDDSILEKAAKTTLQIAGCYISKTAEEPVRYTLSGLKTEMVMESVSSELPVKTRNIKDLVDDDIYTFVTLTDVELPVRKGSLLPYNGGYTKEFSSGSMPKYPSLVHGKDGGSLYMMTNANCPYARNGQRLPYGSGNISGIIVHEHFRPFVDCDNPDENLCGEIGRYQIRHLCREDIDLHDSFSNSFSGLVVEFRYADLLYKAPDKSVVLSGGIPATAGKGSLTHTYTSYSSKWGGTSVWNQPVRVASFSASFAYLGPCGKGYVGHYENGAGIILNAGIDNFPDDSYNDGDEYFPVEKCYERASIFSTSVDKINSALNSEGKGGIYPDMMLNWANKYWWDDTDKRGYCWLIHTSTAGISSDHVSVQFSMYNQAQSNYLNLGSPRYWKIQYSTTTADCSKASDNQWTDVAEFTVPDIVTYGNIKPGQIAGSKAFSFELPTDVLGQENLYIRLMPRNNKACLHTSADYLYDGGAIKNNSGYNTMEYFAIRYNK